MTGETRTRSVRIYLTEADYAALTERAEREGEPLAVTAFRILARALRPRKGRRGRRIRRSGKDG